ncbi:unnamed protein product [Meloidogyne enterolobii]|uniref:Uncharacterized protein n=1 Tax=Meloidogyne enterolobii TaxID=390850 RepID=A0ACB0Y6H4_MELEN
MFPRTTRVANHCVPCLALEAWLRLEKIPFHRISNQFMLGSKENEVPFIQYNGEYFGGIKEIISKLKPSEQQENECLSVGESIKDGGYSLGFSSSPLSSSMNDASSLETLSSSKSMGASSSPLPGSLSSPSPTLNSPSSSISSFFSSPFSPRSLQNSPVAHHAKKLARNKTFSNFLSKATCLLQLDEESVKQRKLETVKGIEDSIWEIYK